MEAITAFLWGPLCPLLVHGIFSVKPWRYTLMTIISVGQIYGDVLYFGTCFLEGGWVRSSLTEQNFRPAQQSLANPPASCTAQRWSAPLCRFHPFTTGAPLLLVLLCDSQRHLDCGAVPLHRSRLGQNQHGCWQAESKANVT
jgi:hypothetical protein